MPGLMALRDRFKKEKPLKVLELQVVFMTIQTAVLIEI